MDGLKSMMFIAKGWAKAEHVLQENFSKNYSWQWENLDYFYVNYSDAVISFLAGAITTLASNVYSTYLISLSYSNFLLT